MQIISRHHSHYTLKALIDVRRHQTQFMQNEELISYFYFSPSSVSYLLLAKELIAWISLPFCFTSL
jgi:hypothetical protein